MNDKISYSPCIKAFKHCGWAFPLISILLCITSPFFSGCAADGMSKNTARKAADGKNEIVYQITEQEALELAQGALEKVLPEQTIRRLKKPRVGFLVLDHEQEGHYKYARFRDATFIYEIDLLRMQGRTAQGQDVVGYTYTLKGKGDIKTGPAMFSQLDRQLKDGFEKTGRAVAVSSLRPETSGAPGIKLSSPPVTESPAAVVPMATVKERPDVRDDDVFEMLKKLKELLDQGIITEEEFKAKKKELLDRI